MTVLEEMEQKKFSIKNKLMLINKSLPKGKETILCWSVGNELNISGQTVKNYLDGTTSGDGFLAEAIIKEFRNQTKKKVTNPSTI